MSTIFCPVCQTSRNIELKDRLSWKMHFQMTVATVTFSSVVYLFTSVEIALRCLIVYLPIWAAAEFIHGVKMRQATKCEVCSFDPILYMRDWKAARKSVEDRLNIVSQEIASGLNERTKRVLAERKAVAAPAPSQDIPVES